MRIIVTLLLFVLALGACSRRIESLVPAGTAGHAGLLNERGIAVIGVDGLWHESFTQSVHVVNGMRKRYDMFSGLVYQHVALQWQLMHLIQDDLRGKRD